MKRSNAPWDLVVMFLMIPIGLGIVMLGLLRVVDFVARVFK